MSDTETLGAIMLPWLERPSAVIVTGGALAALLAGAIICWKRTEEHLKRDPDRVATGRRFAYRDLTRTGRRYAAALLILGIGAFIASLMFAAALDANR